MTWYGEFNDSSEEEEEASTCVGDGAMMTS